MFDDGGGDDGRLLGVGQVGGPRHGEEQRARDASGDLLEFGRRCRGIVLTGGGSLLKNLDKRLREETGLPLAMAEDPLTSVVLGAGKMLSDFNLLRKISID